MIDVDDTAVVGARLALRQVDAGTRRAIAAQTRGTLTPLWVKLIRNTATSRQQRAVYGRAAARSTASGSGTLTAATTSRALSGGLVPATDWPFVEFGSLGAHGRRGQLPRHRPGGHVAFPAAARFAPTAARAWLWAVADTIRGTGITDEGL